MIWKLLQLTVFVSVLSSNGYYQWTPSGFAASVIALVCAFAVTVLLGDAIRLLSWTFNKLRPVLTQQRAN